MSQGQDCLRVFLLGVKIKVTTAFTRELAEDPRKRAGDSFRIIATYMYKERNKLSLLWGIKPSKVSSVVHTWFPLVSVLLYVARSRVFVPNLTLNVSPNPTFINFVALGFVPLSGAQPGDCARNGWDAGHRNLQKRASKLNVPQFRLLEPEAMMDHAEQMQRLPTLSPVKTVC
ncbi:hypothetical protein B0H19DRAFT_1083438 [Mycena capillaripes]|nr:hypothetical protein B0H19DRAFT_1083438 [Mycena capillaripes]